MQLPSSLVSVAESAVQNAQEAGYLQSWPNEVVEQFHYVSALSQFITETIHRDEALAQQLPTMLSELSRHQAYRTRLAALLAECQMKCLVIAFCVSSEIEKWSTSRGKTSYMLGHLKSHYGICPNWQRR